MKRLLLLVFTLLPFLTFGQDENLRYEDYTYLDNIKSVKFHVEGLLLSMPIVNLRSNTALELSFDDLSPDYREYVYTIVHCDADWQPSNLAETEYIDGFTEEVIDDYDYSFKTKSIYTHYYLYLPNEDMQFTKSGNYLLKVYENEDEKRLAITRRFMVVEPVVSVIPNVVRPAKVSKSRTHQEVDFTITHKGFEIRNPRQELSVTVMQNGRWDNAITNLKPLFSRAEEQVFDYQDKIVFPAGKEFRYLDLRSLRYGSENIQYVDYINDLYEVSLYQDKKRSNGGYREFEDINGNFVIETLEEDNNDLESDYANVLFTLKSPGEMYDYDVYIFGGLSDWELRSDCRMVYNPAVNAYVGKLLLKQGYYNYLYAAVNKATGEIDFEETEGNWFEAKNNYTILVYYRPFGSRYDHLIGAYTFSSRL